MAFATRRSPDPSLLDTALLTDYPRTNDSSALLVVEEDISFLVEFTFQGMPAIVPNLTDADFDIETRPPKLPLELLVRSSYHSALLCIASSLQSISR